MENSFSYYPEDRVYSLKERTVRVIAPANQIISILYHTVPDGTSNSVFN